MKSDFPGDELDHWGRLSMAERWRETKKLWEFYLAVGGSLEPDPDPQSPFYFDDERSPQPAEERNGKRLIRRSGI